MFHLSFGAAIIFRLFVLWPSLMWFVINARECGHFSLVPIIYYHFSLNSLQSNAFVEIHVNSCHVRWRTMETHQSVIFPSSKVQFLTLWNSEISIFFIQKKKLVWTRTPSSLIKKFPDPCFDEFTPRNFKAYASIAYVSCAVCQIFVSHWVIE